MAKQLTKEQSEAIPHSFRQYLENGVKSSQAVQLIAAHIGKTPQSVRTYLRNAGFNLKDRKQLVENFTANDGFESSPVSPNQKEVEAFGETLSNDIDSENPLEISFDFSDLKNVVEEISKKQTFTPETSADYEIKPSQVKQVFNETTEHYQLGDKNERWLVLPDIHVPLHDAKTLDAVFEYVSNNYYDGVIQLGDFMDWDFISRWTRENQRTIEGQRFLQEYIHGNAVLDDIQAAVRQQNPLAKIVIFEGNHDWRIESVINKTPALEGMIEVAKNLRFEERNIEYWQYWTHRKPYIIGKAYFIHGLYFGANHAKKTADNFAKCVFYGHTHDRSSHPKTTFDGSSVFCESFGTLSIQEMPYMGKNPHNWSQCFAEFFFRPDGTFNHYVTNIIDHRFIAINGEEYGKM